MLFLKKLSELNKSRCVRWHGEKGLDDWSPERWLTATAGELGEAAIALDALNSIGLNFNERKAKVGEEFADTVIYADLFNQRIGLDTTTELYAVMAQEDLSAASPTFFKIVGALGEAANAMKKAFRIEGEIANLSEDAARHVTSIETAYKIVGQNMAKMIYFCGEHLALHRLSLVDEVTKKFNAVSERYGFPERL